MNRIPSILKNKYVIALLLFAGWILFFDDHDVFSLYKSRQKLEELRQEKTYYQEEIRKTRKALRELTTNPKTLEKFARERYLMKKPREDVFVIAEEEKEETTDADRSKSR